MTPTASAPCRPDLARRRLPPGIQHEAGPAPPAHPVPGVRRHRGAEGGAGPLRVRPGCPGHAEPEDRAGPGSNWRAGAGLHAFQLAQRYGRQVMAVEAIWLVVLDALATWSGLPVEARSALDEALEGKFDLALMVNVHQWIEADRGREATLGLMRRIARQAERSSSRPPTPTARPSAPSRTSHASVTSRHISGRQASLR